MKHSPDIAMGVAKGIHFLQTAKIPPGTPLRSAALALAALTTTAAPGLEKPRERLAAYLLAHKTPQWTFAPSGGAVDMQSTWHALYALRLHNASLIDETALGGYCKAATGGRVPGGRPLPRPPRSKNSPM